MQYIKRKFLHGNDNIKLIGYLATTSSAVYTLHEYNTKKSTKSKEEQQRQL